MNTKPAIPVVVGLGEVLWDCFADSKRPGGAPANVAFQANQLGCRGIVCSRVGTDRDGDELLQFLQSQGLETQAVQRDANLPTGRVTVDTSLPGSPQYVIHEDVAWDALAFDDDVATLMQQADAICFGTLAQRCALSRETIHRCLVAAGEECWKVYDVNLRQRWYARNWIERALRAADCLKLNHAEISIMAELCELPNPDDQFAAAVRDRFGIELVCITRAERGCLLFGDERIEVAGRAVDVIDAVGAGDAFTAALIYARLQDRPIATIAAFANAVGGLVTTRAGAMPLLIDEFAALREEYAV